MTDQKHTIEVELVADSKKLRKELQDTASAAKQMNQTGQRMQAAGLKNQKAATKTAGKQQKTGKAAQKQELLAAKKYEQQLQRTNKQLKQKQKLQEQNVRAVQKEASLTNKLANAKKKAAAAGGAPGKPGVPGEGGGGRGDGRGRGGVAGGAKAVGLAGVAVAGALAAKLVGFLKAQVAEGYATKQQYGRAYSGLIGMGAREELEGARGRAARFGYGGIETAGQAKGIARATGRIGAVTQAQAVSRATGMDVSEIGGFMGTLTQAGQGFGGKAGGGGKKALIDILAAGTASGLDKARMPEFFQSVGTLVQTQAGRTAGDVDTGRISNLLAAMGASGKAGLQGARGGAVLAQIDKAIRAPGGGDQGQAFMLRAMGFGKPGGETSYYEALKKQQRGVTGKGNVEALFAQAEAEYGAGEKGALALSEVTGLSLDQVEALREVVKSNMSSDEKQAEIKKIAGESKSIEEQALESMKTGFADSIEHAIGIENKLIDIGDAVQKPLQDMKELFMKVTVEFLPIIVTVLKEMAALLRDIFIVVNDWLGKGTVGGGTNVGKFSAAKSSEEVTTKLSDLKKQLDTGAINQGEYKVQVQSLHEDLVNLRSKLWKDTGGFWGESKEEKEKRIAESKNIGKAMSQTKEALNYSPLAGGNVTATRSRQAIASFISSTPGVREKLANLNQAQQNTRFVPGGEYFSEFRAYLEANQSQFGDVLKVVKNLANTVEANERDRAEGPASTSRRSGKSPTVDTSGGVSN